MMMNKRARAGRILIGWFGTMALAAAIACGGSQTSPSETTTEPFTGTLKASSAAYSSPFTVAKDGTVTLTVTALSPQSDAAIGLGLGQFVGTTCVIQIQDPGFYVGQPLAFNGIVAGQYCVKIYDIGYLTQDNTFTVTVNHP